MAQRMVFVLAVLMTFCLSTAFANYVPLRNEMIGDQTETVVLRQDSREVHLEIKIPGLELTEGTLEGKKWDRVEIPGGGYELDLGAPEVPHFSRLLIIPSNVSVHAQFEALETTTIANITLMPAQGDDPDYVSSTNASMKFDMTRYGRNELYPVQRVMVGEPAVMRGLRVVTLRTNPVQYNPITHELVVTTKFRVTVKFEGQDLRNVPSRPVALSKSWVNMMKAQSFNFDDTELDVVNSGSYLIIAQSGLSSNTDLAKLVEWKKRKGHSVTVQYFSPGATNSTIKGLIQTAYNTWPTPPEFVLLYGDIHGSWTLPCWPYDYSAQIDHQYSLLDGSDVLADVALGRLPIDTATKGTVLVNKILWYEKDPYIVDQHWFEQGVLVAGSTTSGISTVQTNRFIKTRMIQHQYARIDTFWYTMSGSSVATTISTAINDGVTIMNYRGWIGMENFEISHIDGLTNGRKMPFCTPITCSTGGWSSYSESFMEHFMSVGTSTVPKGAIASIGTATSHTNTRANNVVAMGLYAALFDHGITQPGLALNYGKVELYNTYNGHDQNNVNWFSHWAALAGDPGLELYDAIIHFMNCNVPDQIPYGVNTLSLLVNETGVGPLEGATVSLYKENELQSVGLTNASGQVTLPVTVNGVGNVKVTVVKHNFYPIIDSLNVVTDAVVVGYQSHTVDDDNNGGTSGDNDHVINPGETVDLPLTFKNYGTSTSATGIATTTSESDPYAILSSGTQSFPDMAPGATGNSNGAMRLAVNANCPDGHLIPLTFNTTSGQGSWLGGLNLPVVSFKLTLKNAQFAGSDTLLSPGETANLTLTVKNGGHKTAGNLTAALVSLDPWVTVNDNSASFGSLYVGSTGNCSGDPFNLTASLQAMRGYWANLQVTYTANGAIQVDTIRIKLGNKLVTDPQGPDGYGYYCYDNGDAGYPQKPTYSWVEIAPGYGGAGTAITLGDFSENNDKSALVVLPSNFQFRYYGQEVDTITVCSNGWISTYPDVSFADFRNHPIPSAVGPYGHICPFWDDLVEVSGTPGGYVYQWFDNANHRFIIEWSRLYVLQSTTLEVFEVILYDPRYYPTPTGDGEIVFQYHTINDVYGYNPADNAYSTVGIESPDYSTGIEVVYWNTYSDPAAAHLQAGRAYKFTTAFGAVQMNIDVTLTPINPPIIIPANGGSFDFTAAVLNNGPTQAFFWVWARIKNPDGSYTGNTIGPVSINPPVGISISRVRTQNVPSSWISGIYTYLGYANTTTSYPAIDSSSFTFTKSTTADGGPTIWDATCSGELFPGEIAPVSVVPTSFGLGEARPNPFNPITVISYKLQAASLVRLYVYDTTGRLVAKLVDGRQEAGSYQVTFDGSRLASGLYFVRMEAGGFTAVRKLMLIK